MSTEVAAHLAPCIASHHCQLTPRVPAQRKVVALSAARNRCAHDRKSFLWERGDLEPIVGAFLIPPRENLLDSVLLVQVLKLSSRNKTRWRVQGAGPFCGFAGDGRHLVLHHALHRRDAAVIAAANLAAAAYRRWPWGHPCSVCGYRGGLRGLVQIHSLCTTSPLQRKETDCPPSCKPRQI